MAQYCNIGQVSIEGEDMTFLELIHEVGKAGFLTWEQVEQIEAEAI